MKPSRWLRSAVRTDVVRRLPLQPNLKIVIPIDEIEEPGEKLLALLVRQTIDVLDVPADGEDALPSGDRVGADDRVDRFQLGSYVLGSTARLVVELEPGSLGDLGESRLLERSGQALQELLVRLADAIVDFVSRGPECI